MKWGLSSKPLQTQKDFSVYSKVEANIDSGDRIRSTVTARAVEDMPEGRDKKAETRGVFLSPSFMPTCRPACLQPPPPPKKKKKTVRTWMSCFVTLGLLNESSETGCPHRVALQHFPEILPSRREADQEDAANFFSDFVLKERLSRLESRLD